jgi:hypothetical protein
MASIFDSLSDTTEAPPKPKGTGSIFDSLSESGGGPAPAAPAGGIPGGSPYTAPAATSSDSSNFGKLARGKGVLETVADVGDIVLGGLPAIILGSIGEVTQRASSIFDGRGYREGAKAGAEFSRSMGEKFGRPIFDNLVAAGLLNKETRSVPMQAMDKIGGYLEHAATIVEADSGGAISKEDYLASINGFMAAMGVKGAQVMTQGALNKVKAKGTKSAWNSAIERFDAEEQLARAKFYETTSEKSAAGAVYDANGRDAGAVKSLYGESFTTEAAARREAFLRRKAYEKDLSNFPPSGERTGSRGPVDLALEGKETPTTYSGNQPFSTADQTAGLKRGVVSTSPIETEGALRPAARPALDTGLEKVKGGRLFDMTAEERLAVRNSVDITDPKVITAAAVGATGLGLAMAYEPSAEEAALAIGAGALLRRGGQGESLATIMKRADATPLGAFLEASSYTTSTLEKLADQSPGTYVFKKQSIEQLLKREGVTKHERDLMTAAMAEVPRDTITAKELMVGLKLAAKDFELTPVKSTSYADYGLNRIDRDVADDMEFAANTPEQTRQAIAEREAELPVMQQRAAALEGTRFDDYPYAPRQAQMVVDGMQRELTELRSRLHAMTEGSAPEEPVTRVYRSPLELGSNNHFSDPNYFAHTRSFVEDGVRHVVELQSDLAQKAGKVLKPEERALNVQRSELVSKLDTSGAAERIVPISPMLKDWHKRLVREELADAARNLEPSVRFATADTVAKVEGWPDSGEARSTQLAGAQERLASAKEHVANLEAMKRGEAPKDDYYSALKVADPEAFDRVIKYIDAEISYAQETLRESQLQFDRTITGVTNLAFAPSTKASTTATPAMLRSSSANSALSRHRLCRPHVA